MEAVTQQTQNPITAPDTKTADSTGNSREEARQQYLALLLDTLRKVSQNSDQQTGCNFSTVHKKSVV